MSDRPEPSRARWFALLALAVALMLVAAACGGDDDDSGSSGSNSGEVDTTPASANDLSSQNWQLKSFVVGSGGTLSTGSEAAPATAVFNVRHDHRLDRLQQLHGHVRPREQRRDQVRSGCRDEGAVPGQSQRAGARPDQRLRRGAQGRDQRRRAPTARPGRQPAADLHAGEGPRARRRRLAVDQLPYAHRGDLVDRGCGRDRDLRRRQAHRQRGLQRLHRRPTPAGTTPAVR